MTWGQAPAHAGTLSPAAASAEVGAAAAAGVGAPHPVRARRSSLLVLGILGIVALAVVMLVVAVIVLLSLGPIATVIGGVLALVPLGIVLVGVHWIDRWDPEPRMIVAFAFLWGAGAAVLVAVVVGLQVDDLFSAYVSTPGFDFWTSIIEAPVVEETAKGLGVLLILLVARKHFDGPVDGVVYAAWVAGGFAFTENILYFGSQVLTAGGVDSSLVSLFFVRGLMSPFAHVMFTSCTGLALGLAAQRFGRLGSVGAFLVGLVPAMLLHGLWNGSLYVVGDFLGYYVLVQLPLFIGAVVLVVYLRTHEARVTFDRLSEYAQAGWFTPGEVVSLATGTGRRQAHAWARSRGLWPAMRRYTRDATRLAFTRQRILAGHDVEDARADEGDLLASIVSERTVLRDALGRG